jgi:hypothetical protein
MKKCFLLSLLILSLFICWIQGASAQLVMTVYIQKNCTKCNSEIKALKDAGLEPVIKNIDTSPQAKKEVLEALGDAKYLGINYFPVLLVSDKATGMSGYAYCQIADFAITTAQGITENPEEEIADTTALVEDPKQEITTADISNNDMAKAMVERHNYWRSSLGIRPVTWSDELAKYAQEWANELAKRGCAFEHRPYDGKWEQRYGENIFMVSGRGVTPQEVVDDWAEERKDFDYKTQECKGEWYVCGHYTQIIWENSTQIGCAMVKCNGQEIWVCNYNPPGNYTGEKPYKKK